MQLVAKEEFTAFGVTYVKGAPISSADTEKWPEGTLQRRIEGGDIGFDSSSDAAAVADGFRELEEKNASLEDENRLLKERLEALEKGGGKKGKDS